MQRTVVTLYCDRCDGTGGVERRTLVLVPVDGGKGRRMTFDACARCRHEVPLEEWESMFPPPAKARGRAAQAVVSMDVVESAAKRKARRD